MNDLINDVMKELKISYVSERRLREALMGLLIGTHVIYEKMNVDELDDLLEKMNEENDKLDETNTELRNEIKELKKKTKNLELEIKELSKKKPSDKMDEEIDMYLDQIRYYEKILDGLKLSGYKIKGRTEW